MKLSVYTLSGIVSPINPKIPIQIRESIAQPIPEFPSFLARMVSPLKIKPAKMEEIR